MGIELKFSGPCEGCTIADLEVLDMPSVGGETRYLVLCSHEEACRRARKAAHTVQPEKHPIDSREEHIANGWIYG